MLFRKWGCLVGPENSIFQKLKSVDSKKQPLTTEMLLHFYFPFKAFPENERERESAHVRERRRSSPRSRAPAPVRRRDRWRDRDRAINRDSARSRSRIAIALSRSRSCCRSRSLHDHGLGSRSRRCVVIAISDRDRAVIAISDRAVIGCISGIDDFFFLGCGLCFLICVFLLPFQTPENIFRKIFWNVTKHHGNIFLFRKLAFSKNMYFPENVLQQPNTALDYKKDNLGCLPIMKPSLN